MRDRQTEIDSEKALIAEVAGFVFEDRDRDIERQRHREVERDRQTEIDSEKALIAEVAGFVCGSKEIHRTASSVTGKEGARSTLDDGTPAHQQLTAADWSILFRRTTPSRIACARAEREHGPCPQGH